MPARAAVSAQSSPQATGRSRAVGFLAHGYPVSGIGSRRRITLEDLPEEILRPRDLNQLEGNVAVDVAEHHRLRLV